MLHRPWERLEKEVSELRVEGPLWVGEALKHHPRIISQCRPDFSSWTWYRYFFSSVSFLPNSTLRS